MRDQTARRRDVLRVTGLTAVAAVAGCAGGGDGGGGGGSGGGDGGGSGNGGDGEKTASPTAASTADDTSATEASGGSNPTLDGWLDGVSNYDGVVDQTGSSAATVKVGVDNGGQPYGFGPAAITVSTGTEVTWEWTGKGSSHNVIDEDGAFESELVAEEGHTFSYTFEETGTYKYSCQPHKTLGMKGVVVVE